MIALRVLVAIAIVCYPLIVYAGLRAARVRTLALLLAAPLALRLFDSWRHRDRRAARVVMVPVIAVGAVVALGGILNDGRLFLYVPVLMNLALLVTFGRTLRRGPSMVEALARVQHPTLAPGAAGYCRHVTVVWCGFFVFNIVVITPLAVTEALAAWTAYTGLVAYALMGCLFAAELTYRSWRFRHYSGAPTDVFFRRIFPPRTPA